MSVDEVLLGIEAALQPLLDRWPTVVLVLALVTLLGVSAQNVVGAIATLLRVPAGFARTHIDPLLRQSNPPGTGRLLRELRGYFAPVLDPPARAMGRSLNALFLTAKAAPQWPVAPITDAVVGLVSPLVDAAATHSENLSARLAAEARSSTSELRGKSGRWAGWRVIGGVLFFIGLCFFLYADAALSIASHEKAIGAPVTFLPEWFREVTLAYSIASFVSALMLGLVFFDLIGMTHLGPWDDLDERRRRWLPPVVLVLAALFLLLATFLALWRASVVVQDFIPPDLADALLGVALTAPIPLMLLATALIAWGAIAMPWLVWILVVGALAMGTLLVALVLRAIAMALRPAAVLLGGLLRVAGIVGLAILSGIVALGAAGYFAISVVAVGLVLVIGFVALAVWSATWLLGQALVHTLQLQARITDGLALVLQRVIDALIYPGKTLWNWFASFDRARALHVRPIPSAETRTLRLASTDPEVAEEAIR